MFNLGGIFILAYSQKHSLQSDDTIILLGDVGINYFGNNYGDKDRKEVLNMCGTKILCIHGNHEMRPESISTYKRKKQYGGIVMFEEEYPNITFAIDGGFFFKLCVKSKIRYKKAK